MRNSLLKNTAWGLLGELATRAAKVVQVILMARILGAEEIGRYNYALALAALFGVLFDFGVLTAAVKAMAQAPDSAAFRLYGRVKLLSSLTGIALVAGTALLAPIPTTSRYLVFGLGLYLALTDISNYVVVAYRARREFWRETALRTTLALIQLFACAATLFATRRLEPTVVVLVASVAIGLIPLLGEWRKQPTVGRTDAGWHGMVGAVRQCIPLAGTVLVGTVYMNFDIVMLGRSVPMDQVGWYGVAVKTIFGLLIMPLTYFQLATLPVLATEMSGGVTHEIRERWLQGVVLSTTAGAVLSLGTAVLAKVLLSLMFGADFSAGSPVLVVFTLMGFFYYLYTPMSQWLLLQGKQKWTLYIQMIAMAINLALLSIMVPLWGIWGAVVAAVVTHLTITLGHFIAVYHAGGFTGREDGWRSLFRLTLGVCLGIIVLRAGADWSLVSKAAAVLVFVVCAHRELFLLLRDAHVRIRTSRTT